MCGGWSIIRDGCARLLKDFLVSPLPKAVCITDDQPEAACACVRRLEGHSEQRRLYMVSKLHCIPSLSGAC